MNRTALALVVSILVFSIVLGGVVYAYSRALEHVNADYARYRSDAEAELARRESMIANLTGANEALDRSLEETRRELNETLAQLDNANNLSTTLMGAINAGDADELQTVLWHVSYKGSGSVFGNTDNFTDTYNALKNGSAYNVLLVPELPRSLDWNTQLKWYRDNFTGVPLCVTMFEFDSTSVPLTNMTLEQLAQVVDVCGVRMVRLHELVSWSMAQNVSLPVESIRGILSFCRAHGIGVFWNEWKNTEQVWKQIAACIVGYEDVVTVSYGTNNVFNEPVAGYMAVKERFTHWGASVQPWYWADRNGGDPLDMPVWLLTWHALLAKNMGAEVLQFEPSWYFFDNSGRLNDRGEAFKVMVS
jgi:hypothetical protein